MFTQPFINVTISTNYNNSLRNIKTNKIQKKHVFTFFKYYQLLKPYLHNSINTAVELAAINKRQNIFLLVFYECEKKSPYPTTLTHLVRQIALGSDIGKCGDSDFT